MTRQPAWPLDHVTVVARTLEEGADHIRERLGVEMPAGGAHPRMGTHNRLLALGSNRFLELIAIDPNAPAPGRPRWFDLDRFDGAPRLGAWVLGVEDITDALAQAHPDSGVPVEITRGDLTWLISIPEDGSMPMGGAFPTLIQWPGPRHPAVGMRDLGCRLRALTIEHPDADEILRRVGPRIDAARLSVRKGAKTRLRAEIDTPNGLRTLD